MKLSTLMLASLMTLTSAAAFAGAVQSVPRSSTTTSTEFREKTHGKAEQQVASADGKSVKSETVDRAQPNS